MVTQDLHSVAFPKFSDEDVADMGTCPLVSRRTFKSGDRLFSAGDRDAKFFVVESGDVEILDEAEEPPKRIVMHHPGEFTGEIAQLTGSPALVSAIASGDCNVLEMSPSSLRELLNHHPDLGDIVLQAFIARRQLLREPGNFTGLRVIGSRYSQDAFRVREFLTKNIAPFTWLDLEDNSDVGALLKGLGLNEADTPVVALGRTVLLRNPSNRELAERAAVQASKFGAQLSISSSAMGLSFDNAYSVLQLEGGETVTARCLLIATGADYRLLNVEGCADFECRGVYYAATPLEAAMCTGADVAVVGGGNSAGQAAVFLSGPANKVYLVIRGDDLYKSMSSYLVHRIETTPNIEVLRKTVVQRMTGNTHLEQVTFADAEGGASRTYQMPALFSFIGARPRTEWLPAEVEKDEQSFVLTGPGVARSRHWSLPRSPFLLETSRRGVFAAGDVRSGSTKRVGSAVGEGAMAVQFVHECLKEM